MKSASTFADWTALAAEIISIDGEFKTPAAALSDFAGRAVKTPPALTEAEAHKRTPRHLRDELARAFLFARVAAKGVDPGELNDFARDLSDLALCPLGMAAIEREADRIAGNR